MSSKHPTLLPAGPVSNTTPPGRGFTQAQKSVSKRHMTVNACLGCRRKRTKCDGRSPCSRCVARKERCDYKVKASVTKDDLRAEVESLKQERLQHRAVLHALLLDKHEAVVERLRSGESVDVIAQSLSVHEPKVKTEKGELPADIGTTEAIGSAPEASREANEPAQKSPIGQFNFSDLRDEGHTVLGWPRTPADSLAASLDSSRRPAASRRHSFDATVLTESQPVLRCSAWTKVTANRTHVNRLVRLFFSWEFPPFTMVSEELFLRDYFDGRRRFCSAALVNAVASLATRYMEPDETTSSGDAFLLGEQFFAESKGLLVLEAQIPNLPSIQAFALLAVREMSCGRELEAQELCLQAVRLLSALDFEDLEAHGQLTDHLTVRSITFSGVLSLTRAIRLITDQLSPASNYHFSKMPLVSDFGGHLGKSLAIQLESRTSVGQLQSRIRPQPKPKPAEMLSIFIFDQTDYVYTFLSRTGGRGDERTAEDLAVVYEKCIQSYEAITDFLREQGQSSPYTLFTHIYFHFCLLALFRPFVDHGVDVAGVSPRTVCAEAVQAVLDLTQSYASLFTLRRTPCFIPYFVFAAGLTRIVLESDVRRGSSQSISSPTEWSPLGAVGSSPAATGSTAATSPHPSGSLDDAGDTRMSNVDGSGAYLASPSPSAQSSGTYSEGEGERDLTQAVQQLEEMGFGHPGAAQAGWVLRDFDPHQQNSG